MSKMNKGEKTRPNEKPSKEQSPIKWIMGSTKKFHGAVVFLALLAVLSTVVNLWNAVLLGELIDVAVDGNKDLLIRTAIILAAVTLGSIALTLISRYIREKTSYELINDLQTRLVSVLLGKDYYNVTRTHSQEWMNRLNTDSSTIADAACKIVPGAIGILLHLVGALYLILKTSPSLIMLVLIGGVAVVGLNYALRRTLKQAQRDVRNSLGRKNVYVSEHLSKIMIVKAFGREDASVENTKEKLRDWLTLRMRRLKVLLTKDAVQSGSAKLASLAVLVYCAVKILRGEMSYGTSAMLLRLLSQIRAPLTDVSEYISNIFDVSVAAERLMEPENFPDDTVEPVKSDSEISEFYENEFKEIVFKDAGFSYLDEIEANPNIRPTVFEGVNLTISRKSVVAFTGITGSGKSTFFKLLMSMYPLQEGSKILRCEDGRDIPLDATFRGLFAYVPQGNQLMAGSIREMVAFGTETIVDSDIWAVLETACARDFVEALPQGLDTQIGERGLGLSEGQLQRLAIARALYTKRPILLLDEATSSLDEATERALIENIKKLTNCTILIVTHRPAALSICDQEIHIDGNKVSVKDLK